MITELLLGSPYFKTKKLLVKTQFFSHQQLKRIQDLLLGNVLKNAVENVSFYRKAFSDKRLSDFDSFRNALTHFPIIDKQIIREKQNEFLTGPKFKMLKVTSGGSTGSPVAFYIDRFSTRQIEKAFIFDQWKRVGYNYGDSIFNIRGRTPSKGKFIHHDRFLNIYHASSFNLNIKTISDYVLSIDKIHPRFLHGYPSTMYQLAVLMNQIGKKLNYKPKAVFCGSEKLFSYQKSKIVNVFGCPTYHWYGHSECLALGGECEYSEKLHFYPQYGVTELVPMDVKDENGRELHEIVATGFNNPVMPFIRYRTGDYAIPSKEKNCSCGRNYLLIDEVIGRQQEFIVDANGALISATSLIFGCHYKIYEGIESIKLHQKIPGVLNIVLVKGEGFKDALFQIMKNRMLELIGNKMTLIFSFTEYTEKSQIGKAKLVNQELDINEYLQ